MNYEEWGKTVPQQIRGDSLWKMQAYRMGLFVSDISWADVTKLLSDRRTISISDQLCRAVGAISADLSEGYSRSTGKDRARFYAYALGTARESRDWYYRGRHVLGEAVSEHRISLVTHIIRLLLAMVPEQRGNTLHEDPPEYGINVLPELTDLLSNVPMPEE